MVGWIKNHQILAYLMAVMVWSWGMWSMMLFQIRPGELLQNPPPSVFIWVILGGIGPSLWGIILTKLIDGEIKFNKGKIGGWWAAGVIIPTITFLTPLLRQSFSGIKELIIPGILLGVYAALSEEFGWRGYLLPRLLKIFSPIKATLILGLIWGGLWHGYADFLGLGNKWIVIILLGPILLTAWSMLITWVYLKTNGSLVMAILMHFSISSSALIFGQKYNSSSEELLWTVISVGLAAVMTILLTIRRWRHQ